MEERKVKEPIPKPKLKTFNVWIKQVNAIRVTVTAWDTAHAGSKAYDLWQKEYAHSVVEYIEEVTKEPR